MTDQLIVGELVVAKGKLATIQQILSAKSIRVVVKATGEALMVSQRDIERIVGLTGGMAGGNLINLNVNDYGEDELSLAVERYNVISQWRVKEVTTAQACVKLNLSRSYFFRLAKMCDEEIGPLSLVLQRRGVKKGVTRLDEAVEVIVFDATHKVYNSKGASYSKVWLEVDVACKEQGLPSPCK